MEAKISGFVEMSRDLLPQATLEISLSKKFFQRVSMNTIVGLIDGGSAILRCRVLLERE